MFYTLNFLKIPLDKSIPILAFTNLNTINKTNQTFMIKSKAKLPFHFSKVQTAPVHAWRINKLH